MRSINDIYITPYFSEKISYRPNNKVEKPTVKKKVPFFVIGDTYVMKSEDCGDFEMPTKKYKLVGVVKMVNDVELNSLVMKQIEGEQSMIFSLSKNDCKMLNIEFEHGLQLFPMNLGWVNVSKETKEEKQVELHKPKKLLFDPCNLSTYPLCINDNTIRNIMVKISNCIPNGNGVIMPNGITCFEHGSQNLVIKSKRNIEGDGYTSAYFREHEYIPYKLMTEQISECVSSKIVDVNGCMFIELCLAKKSRLSIYKDGYVGVKPSNFINISLSDFIEISC